MPYIGKIPAIGNYQVLDALTATTTDTYALTKNSVAVFPQTPANCIVSLNGVIQAPFDSYNISGSNIVFDSALTGSDSIDFITVLGDVLNVGTVSDGTIGLAKLSATGTKDATTFLRGDNTFATAGGTNTPIVSLSLSSSQTTTDATDTLVAFDTVDVDTDSAYTNTAGNYKFTVPSGKAGKYMITFMATSFNENSATTMVKGSIFKNGSAIAVQRQRHDGRRHEGTTTHWVGDLSESDYIQFYYYHDVTSDVPQLQAGTEARATITRLIT